MSELGQLPVLSRGLRCDSGPQLGGRPGFSFVEIMFAVMILGIGFILVAGVFPAALSQTMASGDETNTAAIAREAVTCLASLPNTAALMDANGTVHRFGPGSPDPLTVNGQSNVDGDAVLWNEVRGNLILTEDNRYAWVPFYLRNKDANGNPSDSAQVIIIGTRVRNHSAYTPDPDTILNNPDGSPDNNSRATLTGRPLLNVKLALGTNGNPDIIDFSNSSGSTDLGAVAPGTFVIISNDRSAAGATTPSTVSATGWILKIGNSAGANRWELQPGGDLKNSPNYSPTVVDCWVVGQGMEPGTNAFTGGTQDIMAYSSFILLR